MRKPRSDSILETLTEDQKRQLCEWLLTPGLSYAQIGKKLAEKFGVESSSRALSSFYQAYVGAYVIQRRRQAVGLALDVREELTATPGHFSAVTIDALEQQAFTLAQNPMCNPKDIRAIFSLVLKARDQQFDRDKWETEIAEKMLGEALREAAEKINASGLSNADKIAAMRKAAFADVDALQVSGKLVIPK